MGSEGRVTVGNSKDKFFSQYSENINGNSLNNKNLTENEYQPSHVMMDYSLPLLKNLFPLVLFQEMRHILMEFNVSSEYIVYILKLFLAYHLGFSDIYNTIEAVCSSSIENCLNEEDETDLNCILHIYSKEEIEKICNSVTIDPPCRVFGNSLPFLSSITDLSLSSLTNESSTELLNTMPDTQVSKNSESKDSFIFPTDQNDIELSLPPSSDLNIQTELNAIKNVKKQSYVIDSIISIELKPPTITFPSKKILKTFTVCNINHTQSNINDENITRKSSSNKKAHHLQKVRNTLLKKKINRYHTRRTIKNILSAPSIKRNKNKIKKNTTSTHTENNSLKNKISVNRYSDTNEFPSNIITPLSQKNFPNNDHNGNKRLSLNLFECPYFSEGPQNIIVNNYDIPSLIPSNERDIHRLNQNMNKSNDHATYQIDELNHLYYSLMNLSQSLSYYKTPKYQKYITQCNVVIDQLSMILFQNKKPQNNHSSKINLNCTRNVNQFNQNSRYPIKERERFKNQSCCFHDSQHKYLLKLSNGPAVSKLSHVTSNKCHHKFNCNKPLPEEFLTFHSVSMSTRLSNSNKSRIPFLDLFRNIRYSCFKFTSSCCYKFLNA